jgi:ribosomal protein L37AE/L43A
MNTPIEIMKAIVENGGEVEGWVSENGKDWVPKKLTGADISSKRPFNTADNLNKFASLTDPNKTYKPLGPWVNDWANWRAVDSDGRLFEYPERPGKNDVVWTGSGVTFQHISNGHDPTNWENSLEERPKDDREACPNCYDRKRTEYLGNGIIGCADCKKPWIITDNIPQTRPMTLREFARFVGENFGKYLYKKYDWYDDQWLLCPANGSNDPLPTNWLYANNTKGDLEWMELPQTEVDG